MPVHTDRDQRIEVQFHWQRGGAGSHRLDHPTGDDNAPTNDASGTWVRLGTPIAVQNWGSAFTPRRVTYPLQMYQPDLRKIPASKK